MSTSLIGRFGSSAFKLPTSAVSTSLAGLLLFEIGTKALPSYERARGSLRAINRIRAGKDRLEKDWIECDVHFGMDAHYLGYLYAIARASG